MKKKVVALISALAVILMFTACASTSTPDSSVASTTHAPTVTQTSTAGEKDYTIGLSLPNFTTPGWVECSKQAQAFCDKQGIKLISVACTKTNADQEQIDQFSNLIAQGVDAIAFSPNNSQTITPAIEKAQKAGIVLVNLDSKVDTQSSGLETMPYVGADNEQGAYLAAKYLVQCMGGSGKVCIIEGQPGHFNNEVRKTGAKKAFSETGVELVTTQAGHWEAEQSMNVLTNILQANPDITGVFTCNDTMSWGCSEAVKKAGKTGKIFITSFDGQFDTIPYIKSGAVAATLDQRMDEMGVLGIQVAMKMLAGQKVEMTTPTDVRLWNKDNINQLFPD